MIKNLWRWIKKISVWLFVSSFLYLLICKWVMPPITITQIDNSFSFGLKRDYISGNKITRNAKLAAIALSLIHI
jgi:monofunctional biosynthetic peptidoglycan transglycosylase